MSLEKPKQDVNNDNSNKKIENDSKSQPNNNEESKYLNSQFIGTSPIKPKSYFRLTSMPKESEVRPKSLLIEWFNELMSERQNHSYSYLLDQLKGIRQDVSIQNLLKDEFVISLYSQNLSLALENSDWSEFAICLSQLLDFIFPSNSNNNNNEKQEKEEINSFSSERKNEFIALRILWFSFASWKQQLATSFELSNFLIQLNNEQIQSKTISIVLKMCLCLFTFDYNHFFKLLAQIENRDIQNLCKYITQQFRIQCTSIICKVYSPTKIPLDFFLSQLGLKDLMPFQKHELDEILSNLEIVENKLIDCKLSLKKMK